MAAQSYDRLEGVIWYDGKLVPWASDGPPLHSPPKHALIEEIEHTGCQPAKQNRIAGLRVSSGEEGHGRSRRPL